MSDPVTNVEIEDVLSSIRRLVSDGDKARTRDPAPVAVAPDVSEPPVEEVSESTADAPQTDRLVLTPAFLVVDEESEDCDEGSMHDTYDDASDEDDHWQEEEWAQPEGEAEQTHEDADVEDADSAVEDDAEQDETDHGDTDHDNAAQEDAPLTLTDPVDETSDTAEDVTPDDAGPDRSGLVATIAELEAAMSESTDEFEPDGSEPMAETIPWPGARMRAAADIEDADVAEDPVEPASAPSEDAQAPEAASFEHRAAADTIDPIDDASDDDFDDLDGLLDVGGATIDEEALRDLVAEVVREELTGPLGERITRNVRKLVRREIYRILSSQEFD